MFCLFYIFSDLIRMLKLWYFDKKMNILNLVIYFNFNNIIWDDFIEIFYGYFNNLNFKFKRRKFFR